ncbi:BON domain-containing protein [Mycobacteroides franklinii]|uniref:BON domain-containing protein n=1 Tax=Mycobacteroides franklinii TaxID=948102 RepID=A0A4V3A6R6_9MYCO|nr:BON domain-containing protein [Mycobacteroides franklinii]ORA62536.1 transporter [Mycobacteroides franklinii]TDH25897.1 BON domain-containing protein [Mycobacteroides franklinii]
MTTANPTRNDSRIQDLVRDELEWASDVDAAHVGVAVNDGTVTLAGEVCNYSHLLAAKRAALRVRGVTAIVDDLRVHPPTSIVVTETDIAKEIDRALRGATNIPDTVKAEVNGSHVTLSGHVKWDFQRRAAEHAVEHLRGVHSVRNTIALAPRVAAADTAAHIKHAIIRNAQLDAKTIDVAVSGNKVTLTGTVRSWAEKRQAETAAWSSPHVTQVENHITVLAL